MAHFIILHTIYYQLLCMYLYGYILKQDSAFLPYILYNRNNREQQRRIDCIRFEQVLFRFIVHEVLFNLFTNAYLYLRVHNKKLKAFLSKTNILPNMFFIYVRR